MDDLAQRLEAEYCPPIDSALFSAIIFDYDLSDPDSALEARVTLDALKATAVEEEATGFDASGSGAQRDYSPGHSASLPETTDSASKETDLTSLSNRLSSVDLRSEASSDTADQNLNSLDKGTKVALLKELFSSLSEFTISNTLQQHDCKWKPTLDDLLNQVYFTEDGTIDGGDKISTKGIDAFSEDHVGKRGRKGKKRGKNLRIHEGLRSSSLPTSPSEARAPVNRWQTAQEDIDFISDRANIPQPTVLSLYNRHGRSVPQTIASILQSFVQEDHSTEDPGVQVDAYELAQDFPTIAPGYLTALIKLTQPSTAAAHELAKALTRKQPFQDGHPLSVVPQYAPIRFSDDEDSTAFVAFEASSASTGLGDASSAAYRLSAARQTAMEQARAAYRKSKSDRLMGGAAGYYSQVGREHGAALQQYNAAAADALVASQSSALEIDLHGVTVQDAVRISRQKVNGWWNGLGENKVNGRLGALERASGFRIVTGVGRHSQGGRGVLGPAVKKGLEQDGWKVETGSGAIIVKGKSRTT